ncbi:LacI family DNA-binding transcriptional regulator [Rugosimonospora acidiphila]|uniref:LacI family DNA-binding transcriptional regulator n=1 Tax=Rugosimonospora acidiphila TaxID=556531 RepID=A0ABP9SPN0_9ACTN
MTGPETRPVTGTTLAEVAREAGVSIATASRVLNNSTKVSAEAYRSVCDAASRLGYRRHRAAWGKAHRKMPAIAAVIHAGHHMLFTEPFFARFIGAAELELAQFYIPLLVTSVTGPLIETVGRYLQGGRIDGVIIVSDHGPLPLSGSLATLGLPIVVVGRPLHTSPVSYVDADNRGGARTAVEHLIATGRRAIAHIAAPPDTGAGADRLAGYRDAMRAIGAADTPIAYGDWTQASGVHAMQRLLDQRPALDAVFVASDVMAAGALRCLNRAGRRVPDSVALVGFDDHALAAQVRPALTTVRQPIEEFAAVAVRRLLAMTRGEADDRGGTVLPTQLILRASA